MMMSRTNGERQDTAWQAAREDGTLNSASLASDAILHQGVVLSHLSGPTLSLCSTPRCSAFFVHDSREICRCVLSTMCLDAFAPFVSHRWSRASTRLLDGAGKRPFRGHGCRRSIACCMDYHHHHLTIHATSYPVRAGSSLSAGGFGKLSRATM